MVHINLQNELERRAAKTTAELVKENARLQQENKELRQANQALRERGQQLQQILDNSPAVIYLIDSENKHLLVNRSYAQLLSRTSEELLGKSIYDVWKKETADIFAANNRLVLRKNQLVETEEVVPQSDGIHTYITLKFPIYNSEGIVYAVCGISTDITERKRTELELRTSEAKASSLTNDVIDKSPVGIFILDADFRVVWLNQALEKFFGVRKEKIIGQDKRQLIRQHIAQIFESPELFTNTVIDTYDNNTYIEKFECHVLPEGNREERWLEHLSQPILSGLYAGGRIEHYTDITERIFSERKIHEQATLIDIASDAIFVRDLENRILFWSQGAERLYGWTAEEARGKKAPEMFEAKSSSKLQASLNTTIEQGSWQGELEQCQKDGRKIIVESRWTLMGGESRQPCSILVVNTDITEKKSLSEQFYRTQRLESLGTLASGIAHDLNNILTPIMAVTQILPSYLPAPNKNLQQLLSICQSNVKRAADLVKQILTFTRGTEGERGSVLVKQLIEEIQQVAEETFPKTIEIQTSVSQNLWTVNGDASQIHQVLMNLAVNARDAMLNGGTLKLSAQNYVIDQNSRKMNIDAREGQYILITVSDTGTGISPEILDRIFEPFFTTKEVGQGTGLGLSSVLGIVKSHDGFVNVQSEMGRGTQFQVFLPAKETEATKSVETADLPTGNGELILVVDDEANICQINRQLLQRYNYRVLTAKDGVEAIALYTQYQEEIKVVLMDLMMPQMDGITAIRTLKQINPLVKIISVSGVAHNQKSMATQGLNLKPFLLKPYTTRELLKTILEAIETS